MAKKADLVAFFGKRIEGGDKTARETARHAQEADGIAIGGRGPAAPNMSVRDATNMLLAVTGSGQTNHAGRAISTYRALTGAHDLGAEKFRTEQEDDLFAGLLGAECQFGSALEDLLRLAGNTDFDKYLGSLRQPRVRVRIGRPLPWAEIEIAETGASRRARKRAFGSAAADLASEAWLRYGDPKYRPVVLTAYVTDSGCGLAGQLDDLGRPLVRDFTTVTSVGLTTLQELAELLLRV
jgi:hypothetical protein